MIRQLRSFPNQLTLLRLAFIPFIVINVVGQNYRWALTLFILAGLSDFLDGVLARVLKQRTQLGQYLDPIADKMLLSTMFLVLSIAHKIPWKYTVLVFSRDVFILIASAVLYITNTLRDFRPSIFGKLNTCAQIAAVFFVMLRELSQAHWIATARRLSLGATMALTIISGVHYVILAGQRMRAGHGTGASAA
ncbi:MAG: CDP-alcohol phosphatidyltransferase family protein [Acidobacteriaceae bacterium]|nr:CDP-alcohol phosphatidyltransferase family protein [Acidobacteriaceae bacterium]